MQVRSLLEIFFASRKLGRKLISAREKQVCDMLEKLVGVAGLRGKAGGERGEKGGRKAAGIGLNSREEMKIDVSQIRLSHSGHNHDLLSSFVIA